MNDQETTELATPAPAPLKYEYDSKGTLALIDDNIEELSAACVNQDVTAQHLRATIVIAMGREPRIAECTNASKLQALFTAAKLGLDPTGFHNSAHFIVYKQFKKDPQTGRSIETRPIVQIQIGYNGLIELVTRSEKIRRIVSEVVYEGEHFRFRQGSWPEHDIDLSIRNSYPYERRGEGIIAAYAVAVYEDGGTQTVVVDRNEIEIARLSSKTKDFGPWKVNPIAMKKKTAIRSLAKYLVLDRVGAEGIRISDEGDGYGEWGGRQDTGRREDPELGNAIRSIGKTPPEIVGDAEATTSETSGGIQRSEGFRIPKDDPGDREDTEEGKESPPDDPDHLFPVTRCIHCRTDLEMDPEFAHPDETPVCADCHNHPPEHLNRDGDPMEPEDDDGFDIDEISEIMDRQKAERKSS